MAEWEPGTGWNTDQDVDSIDSALYSSDLFVGHNHAKLEELDATLKRWLNKIQEMRELNESIAKENEDENNPQP